MNVDKAMEIINQISSKLGVAAEYIIPELARMRIAQSIVGIMANVSALAVAWVVITKAVKYLRQLYENDTLDWSDKEDIKILCTILIFITIFITTVIGIGTAVDFFNGIIELSGWLASPTAKSIEYVMRALK